MERSEAKKAADKRYAQKIQREGKHKDFCVHFNHAECDRINAIISDNLLSKADFIRFSAELLEPKMQVVYPAIFTKEQDAYIVSFPDLPGVCTDGQTLEEAFLMAGDALYCFLSDFPEPFPKASNIINIQPNNDSIVMLIKPWLYRSEDAKQYITEEKSK